MSYYKEMISRDSYYDALRGFAIIFVIAIHTFSGGDFKSISGILRISLREFCNIAVPLFLVISGYFIGKKDLSSKENYFSFLKKQIVRVYLPCIIWSLPVISLWAYKGYPLDNLIYKLLGCSAFGPYYFIALIIQLYILTPLLRLSISNSYLWWGAAVINFIAVVLLNYYIREQFDIPFVLLVGPFIYWIVFYYFGVFLSGRKAFDFNIKTLLIISIIMFLPQLFEAKYVGVGIKVSSWIWAFIVIAILMSEKVKIWFKQRQNKFYPIIFLGEYSFGIYLSHMYILMFIQPYKYNWIVDTLFVILGSTFLVLMLELILPKKIASKILGIK